MMVRMYTMIPAVLGGAATAADPLRHNAGNAATGGIWRVTGSGGTAILKLARPPSPEQVGSPMWQTSDDPGHWNYWRREELAYASGLTGVYADAGIVAPEFLGSAHRDDGQVEVWLSDVAGPDGFTWSIAQFGSFARRLGAAQGAVAGLPELRHRPAPQFRSRDWLRQYLRYGPASTTSLTDEQWEHPAAAEWPEPVRASLRRLWHRRADVLAAAETAPRTLCHLDVWPANLIGAGPLVTLLDWAFIGDGGLGEDPANLIVDAVTDGLMDVALLPEIDAAVSDGYCAGLRDGGWSGDTDAIRAAIHAYAAAKYSWFAPRTLADAIHDVDVTRSSYGQGTSAQDVLSRRGGIVTLLAEWADVTLA